MGDQLVIFRTKRPRNVHATAAHVASHMRTGHNRHHRGGKGRLQSHPQQNAGGNVAHHRGRLSTALLLQLGQKLAGNNQVLGADPHQRIRQTGVHRHHLVGGQRSQGGSSNHDRGGGGELVLMRGVYPKQHQRVVSRH